MGVVVMKASDVSQLVNILIQRGEVAQSNDGTLQDYIDAVRHPLEKVRNRDDLVTVIAFLTAQVVGAQRRLDADEHLALINVERVVKEWREAQARTA